MEATHFSNAFRKWSMVGSLGRPGGDDTQLRDRQSARSAWQAAQNAMYDRGSVHIVARARRAGGSAL